MSEASVELDNQRASVEAWQPECDCYPHGPQEPCTCNGCHYCTGHKHGCTCDINWACTEHDLCPQRAANQRLVAMADQIHDFVAEEVQP